MTSRVIELFVAALFVLTIAAPAEAAAVKPKTPDPCPKPNTECENPSGDVAPGSLMIVAPLSGFYAEDAKVFVEAVISRAEQYKARPEVAIVDSAGDWALTIEQARNGLAQHGALIVFDPTQAAAGVAPALKDLISDEKQVVLVGRTQASDTEAIQLGYDVEAAADLICPSGLERSVVLGASVPAELAAACKSNDDEAFTLTEGLGFDSVQQGGMFPEMTLVYDHQDFALQNEAKSALAFNHNVTAYSVRRLYDGSPESGPAGQEIVLLRTRDLGTRALDLILLEKEGTVSKGTIELQFPLLSE